VQQEGPPNIGEVMGMVQEQDPGRRMQMQMQALTGLLANPLTAPSAQQLLSSQLNPQAPESPFSKIDPSQYTSESLNTFQQTGNFSALRPRVSSANIAKELETNFKNAKDLRGEFTQATKSFADINDAFGRIKVSAQNPSPAGDMSLIFNFMKMLDPASVVRESEFALAAASGSYGERVKAAWNKVATGEKLSKSQRDDFVNRSMSLFNESSRIHTGRVKEFSTKASQFGVDPSQVIFQRQFHDTTQDVQPGQQKVINFEDLP
jgi:hypothetical protein